MSRTLCSCSPQTGEYNQCLRHRLVFNLPSASWLFPAEGFDKLIEEPGSTCLPWEPKCSQNDRFAVTVLLPNASAFIFRKGGEQGHF
ncbi:hypothetical protein FKM82_029543 [Ascaphus truei]